MSWGQQWAPYVSVGEKLNKAAKKAAALAKKQKREPSPVKVQGRNIAKTFWGKAWCDNLTAYQDYSNRLPRGATYVRNGSVVDLVIGPKKIEAIVAGSDPYTVKIEITALDSKRWKAIRTECSESIDSLLDLLSGKLSDGVMQRLTDQKTGLFPAPREIKMSCSCPDYSSCCKHLAAVMYGIGARLDSQPELLFLLRGVDHQELVSQAIAAGNLDRELSGSKSGGLDSNDLGAIFGIELDSVAGEISKPAKKKRTAKAAAPETAVKAAVLQKLRQKSESRTVKAKAKAAGPKTKATKSAARSTSKSSRTKVAVKSAKKKTDTVKTTSKRSSRS
ncbi:MAG: SWIM zinc finger family protein [Planctomycetaceae bacterium]|nr:SWIM zinc finger family protein [Planctomycetaceae bacterium]